MEKDLSSIGSSCLNWRCNLPGRKFITVAHGLTLGHKRDVFFENTFWLRVHAILSKVFQTVYQFQTYVSLSSLKFQKEGFNLKCTVKRCRKNVDWLKFRRSPPSSHSSRDCRIVQLEVFDLMSSQQLPSQRKGAFEKNLLIQW